MPDTRTASCNCGAIRIEARGQPARVGLCHCTTCRKASGTPFTASGIWGATDVTVLGDTASWKDSTVARHFCPSCGSAVFGAFDGVIAIGLGAFDVAPTDWCQPTSCGWRVGRSGFRWRRPRSSFRGSDGGGVVPQAGINQPRIPPSSTFRDRSPSPSPQS